MWDLKQGLAYTFIGSGGAPIFTGTVRTPVIPRGPGFDTLPQIIEVAATVAPFITAQINLNLITAAIPA